jgi:hypothetical protein
MARIYDWNSCSAHATDVMGMMHVFLWPLSFRWPPIKCTDTVVWICSREVTGERDYNNGRPLRNIDIRWVPVIWDRNWTDIIKSEHVNFSSIGQNEKIGQHCRTKAFSGEKVRDFGYSQLNNRTCVRNGYAQCSNNKSYSDSRVRLHRVQ